jgi:hypothetical protein
MNARCCWPPESLVRGRVDRFPVAGAEAPERAQRRPAGGDDLAHGGRRLDAELRALGEVPEPRALAEVVGRLAEQPHAAPRRLLESQHEPQQRRLAAAVGARDRQELTRLDPEVDPLQDRRSVRVGEVDACQLDR